MTYVSLTEWYSRLGPKKCSYSSKGMNNFCGYYEATNTQPSYGKRCTHIGCPLRFPPQQLNKVPTVWKCKIYVKSGREHENDFAAALTLTELLKRVLFFIGTEAITKIEAELR